MKNCKEARHKKLNLPDIAMWKVLFLNQYPWLNFFSLMKVTSPWGEIYKFIYDTKKSTICKQTETWAAMISTSKT